MPEIIKIEETCEGYTCDKCGVVVSRNEPDGAGGIKWWGVRAALKNKQDEEIKVRFNASGLAQMSLQGIGHEVEKAKWIVCHKCADELQAMLDEWMKPKVKERAVVAYDGLGIWVDEFNLGDKNISLLTGYCEYCNKYLAGEDATPQVDPYDSEIEDDHTLHLICPTCIEASNDEI